MTLQARSLNAYPTLSFCSLNLAIFGRASLNISSAMNCFLLQWQICFSFFDNMGHQRYFHSSPDSHWNQHGMSIRVLKNKNACLECDQERRTAWTVTNDAFFSIYKLFSTFFFIQINRYYKFKHPWTAFKPNRSMLFYYFNELCKHFQSSALDLVGCWCSERNTRQLFIWTRVMHYVHSKL